MRTPGNVGDTRKELLRFVATATRITENDVLAGLASEIATRPELARAYRERAVEVRLTEVGELIARAINRGDLRPDTNVRLAHELLVGPRIYRLLFSGATLNRRHAAEVVDAVMTAFAPPQTDSSHRARPPGWWPGTAAPLGTRRPWTRGQTRVYHRSCRKRCAPLQLAPSGVGSP